MKRRILVAAFMLLSVAALGLSNQQSVCAFGFCDKCTTDCYVESVHVYYQCRSGGGSYEQCDAQERQYYCNCVSLFCSGCGDQPKCNGN